MDTFACPPPPFETVAPDVKSIVVTLTTGVIPSVTVNGLPPPEPPAPVISIYYFHVTLSSARRIVC